jgi:hypothetical protein
MITTAHNFPSSISLYPLQQGFGAKNKKQKPLNEGTPQLESVL